MKIESSLKSVISGSSRYPYNKQLTVHTTDSRSWERAYVANWVEEQGHFIPHAILGGVRHPQGTPSQLWNSNSETYEHAKWYTFGVSNINPASTDVVATFANFVSFYNMLDDPDIYTVINVYMETYNDIVIGIEKYKAAFGYRKINWELGNEVMGTEYGSAVTTAFSTLTGTPLDTAYSYIPSGKWLPTGGDYVAKCKPIIAYIRTNYPNDKIGVCNRTHGGHRRPDGYPIDYGSNSEPDIVEWARAIQRVDVDAVIEHPYMNPHSGNSWTLLNNSNTALYTDSKWLDGGAGGTANAVAGEPAENFYRWIMAFAQDGPSKTMIRNQQRHGNKELWLTEVGLQMDPKDTTAGGYIDAPTEVTTGNCQSVHRALWFVSIAISWLEQIAITNGRVKTVSFHSSNRGLVSHGYVSHFMNEIYPNPVSMAAQGIAYYFLAKLIDSMTFFQVAAVNTTSIEVKGILGYVNTRIKPVRLVYFDNGSTKRALILNISPDIHNVTIDFTPSNYVRFDPAANSLDLWSDIPVSIYFDDTDFVSATHTSNTYAAPAYSITVLN